MARALKFEYVEFDGEFHMTGGICWCEIRHDEDSGINIHPLKFDQGITVCTAADIEV